MITQLKELIEEVYSKALWIEDIHDNFIDTWYESKKDIINNLFGGNLILEKEIDIEGNYKLMESDLDAYRIDLANYLHCQTYYLPNASMLYNNRLVSQISVPVNGESVILPGGMKFSRALKLLIKDKVELDRFQTRYSQIVNTKKIKGTLCISVHPLDFLTMSVSSGWSSCYNYLNGGEYRSGALEMLFANNTILSYVKAKRPYKLADDLEWNDKKWRATITLLDEGILVGRNYPYSSDEISNEVYSWLRELTNRTELPPKTTPLLEWEKENDSEVYVEKGLNYGYNDLNFSKGTFRIGAIVSGTKDIGVEYQPYPVCPNCGQSNEFYSSDEVCVECTTQHICECCGDTTHPDYTYFAYNEYGESVQICESCYDNFYGYCERCEEIHHYDNIICTEDGYYYCQSCADAYTFTCANCCETFSHNTEGYCGNNGTYCCAECLMDSEPEEEEEEC
jgi:hypothetical protein